MPNRAATGETAWRLLKNHATTTGVRIGSSGHSSQTNEDLRSIFKARVFTTAKNWGQPRVLHGEQVHQPCPPPNGHGDGRWEGRTHTHTHGRVSTVTHVDLKGGGLSEKAHPTGDRPRFHLSDTVERRRHKNGGGTVALGSGVWPGTTGTGP